MSLRDSARMHGDNIGPVQLGSDDEMRRAVRRVLLETETPEEAAVILDMLGLLERLTKE